MTFASALSALYAISGIAACLCYLPQVWRLARNAETRRAMSLAAWGGWLAVSAVSLLYAVVVVGQPEMAAVSALNTMGQIAIVVPIAWQRWADRGKGS
jgi:hypothetical protein